MKATSLSMTSSDSKWYLTDLALRLWWSRKVSESIKLSLDFILEYDSQLADLETLFNNMSSLDHSLTSSLDPAGKGFVELDDLLQEIEAS